MVAGLRSGRRQTYRIFWIIRGDSSSAWFAPKTRMKYWEVIADNLSNAGWNWGCVSAIDSNGRTIWIADAYRDGGKRYVVRADEKLTAFLELEAAIWTPSLGRTYQ